MERTQQRFERFAQLRAAYPEQDYDEIMGHIYDEELEADERAHYTMLDAQEIGAEMAYEAAHNL